jgi:hypothetical protein
MLAWYIGAFSVKSVRGHFAGMGKTALSQAGFGVNFCVRTLLNRPLGYLDLDCRGPFGSATAAPDHGALVPMLLKRRMWLWA